MTYRLCLLILLIGAPLLVLARYMAVDNVPTKPQKDASLISHSGVPVGDTFVGSAQCRECHQEIYAQFAHHPMANSLRSLADDDPALYTQTLSAILPGKKRSLTVEASNQQLIHGEQAFDSLGQRIYHQPHSIHFVVGSGRRARAYLERRGDLLYMSPINWYSQSQAWNLAPGYLPDDIRRFDRRVRDDCLACHSGLPVIEAGGANIYPEPVFHEASIGCERCHGPASTHVARQLQPHLASADSDSIINPQKLDADRRDAVCYQCHLESAARVLQPGKSHLDFRPGMRLTDVWAILDQGTQVTAAGHTRSVNHVQQMRDSQCYLNSNNQMGCTSCHDPHASPQPDQRTTFYRQRCLTCHSPDSCTEQPANREKQLDNCTNCHMPPLSSSNMTHVAQTDHRILRHPEPAPAHTADSTPQDREISLHLFGSAQQELAPSDKQRALVLGTIKYCQRKGMPLPASIMPMLEQQRAMHPDDEEVLTKLGGLYLDKGLIAEAEDCFQQCLNSQPHNELAHDGLLEALYRQAKWSATIEQASKMLTIEPTSSRTLAMRADALSKLNRHAEALADIAHAIQANPGQVVLRQWQVDQLRSLNRTDEANQAATELERVRTSQPLAP